MTVKYKKNIFIFGFLLVFLLIYLFVINPLYQDIRTMSKELDIQADKLTTLQVSMANLEEFKNTYESLEEILTEIDGLLVDSEVPVEFISFLEEKAKKSNLVFQISSASAQISKTDPWPYINFQATATGDFPNLVNFLEQLENSLYLIEIRNINIRESENGNINANFSIKVFAK